MSPDPGRHAWKANPRRRFVSIPQKRHPADVAGGLPCYPAGNRWEGWVKRIERLLRAIDRFQQRHSVLGFPFGVVKKYGDDRGGRHAALLAHYGLLCLFPLLLVFVTVLGYALANDPQLQEDVIETLARQFPVLGTQIEGSIRTIKGSGLALVVGVLGTLWGGLGITQSFQDAMNDIWTIPRRKRPNFWWRLARGLGALLLVAGEVMAATVLAQRGIAGPGLFGRAELLAGSFLLNFLLLAVLFQVLTGMTVRFRWLLPGAAVGALGWSVLQSVGVTIVSRQLEQANLVYGVFAVVIVLLGWLYLGSPAGAVRGRDQRGPGPAAVAPQHAPAAAHRAGPPGADRARPDRGAPARAAGPGHLPPRGGRRRRPVLP